MQRRVLLTVQREGDSDARDLELPTDVPAEDLRRLLCTALDWPINGGAVRLRLEPDGRVLEPQESLGEAGAANGAWLVIANAQQHAAAPVPVAQWAAFPSPRPLPRERHIPLLQIGGMAAAVLVLAGAALVVARPGPSPVPVASSAPSQLELPTIAPTVEPTPQPVPTPAPTVAPPTPVPSPTAPPRLPTVVATTVVDASSQWPVVLAQLDPLWGTDWPRAIDLTQNFLARYPNYAPATDKLYVALVEYGKQLRDAGRTAEARTAWEGASTLEPGRGEARAELEELDRPVAIQPTAVPVQSAPMRAAPPPPSVFGPAPAPASPPAPAAPVVEAPPAKLPVTRDGFQAPENGR